MSLAGAGNRGRETLPFLLLALALSTVAACSCGTPPGTTELKPDPIVEDGAVVDPTDPARWVLDFGTVGVGKTEKKSLTIRNQGTTDMTVPPIGIAAPFETDFGADNKSVPVNATLKIEFSFAPDAAGSVEQVVTVQYQEGEISVRLTGVGVVPEFDCTPLSLDFGNVVHSTARTLSLTCTNSSVLDGVLVLSQMQGDDASFFSLSAGGEDGRVLVPSQQHVDLAVTFSASGSGQAFAFFTLTTEEGSSVGNVTLQAVVIDSALQRDPDVTCGPGLDFGFVAPGTSVTFPMTLRNLGTIPLEITGLVMDPASDPEFTVTPPSFSIPADDPATELAENEVIATFTFSPTDLGRRQGMVNLESSDPNSPRLQICVSGFGGGPTLSCSPASIDFGQVAVGVPVGRSYVCTNAGTDDPTTTDDNLVIESVLPTAGEFSATVRGGAQAGGYGVGQIFNVDVTYSPVDEGVDNAAIVIRNNDTANLEHRTLLSGNGRNLPPCQFEIRPPQLRFGIVDRGNTATLEFGIVNLLDTECLITDLRMGDLADPAFTLANGPVAGASIPGFGELRVPVTFAPPDFGPAYRGQVQFYISDPAAPFQTVDLRGASQEPCALIAPDDLDFGTVQPGCSTRDRELQIINVCDSAISVTAIDMNAGASEEFFVRTRPPFPKVIQPGLSATFTMAYRPVDEGVDLGSVFITTAEAAEPYMATLRGRGANDATQTDVFSQDDRPKVDVLWVIDNSGSLSEEQAQVAANSALFLQFAIAQQIDFQIGVTTTGLDEAFGCPGGAEGGEDGRLYPVDNSHPRILTPATANLETHWAFNTSVGVCHGSELGLEAAYRALSPPLIDSADDPRHPEPDDGNLGFLRRDAHLSLIFVSDEEDQSPQTTNFYYNFFLSLKGFRNANLFSAHAIVGDPLVGCATAEHGDRYIDVATRSGGVFQSVCQQDWSQSMETIGTAAFGFKTRFFLTNQPEDGNQNGIITDAEGDLEVRLDGRVYPSVGPRGDRRWEYEAGVNAIDFYPLAVPEPGTQVEVSYRVACL